MNLRPLEAAFLGTELKWQQLVKRYRVQLCVQQPHVLCTYVCVCFHQMDILKKTVHLLHGQADNSLTRITRLFQDERDPCVGVGK